MNTNELLLSISNLMDQKLKPIESHIVSIDHKVNSMEKNINAKFDYMEEHLSARIDDVENSLSARIDAVDRKLDASVERLDSSIHRINLKLENLIEPRLSEIENCYLTTYERYKVGNEKFEKIETDISILQSVVMEHHEKLQTQTV